ncbi:MAG TPA: isoprenylcysteine carboxylmethyltransferase family protein [Alphaproteobacteria bacterium]|jgi:protein-S-isoprenylcysteine O-methyltransferase Ste14
MANAKRSFSRWLQSTSRRTFVVYPLCVVAIELALYGRDIAIIPWGLPLLLWGYLQYRLVGNYRERFGGGGPGIEVPPDRILNVGPYRWVRNPMYLGHLIFMTGLAITFQSWFAVGLVVFHLFWFQKRVIEDEARLEACFGTDYVAYKARVKRWIPGVL